MIQSMEKQLQVVLRALNDVVAPALTSADKHVVEQLHLSIASLSFVTARLPGARAFYRHELSSYLDLADAVIAAARGGAAAQTGQLTADIAAGHALLTRPDADIGDYEQATRRCREGIADVSDAQEPGPSRQDVERVIMTKSEGIIAQARQWCAPFGFELNPDELPAPAW